MGRIDRALALRMMLDGKGDRGIAEHFGTSRQAVNLLRKALVNEGKLEAGPRVHSKPEQGSLSASRRSDSGNPDAEPQVEKNSQTEPTYEQITRWVVRVVTEAAEVARLRQDLSDARAQFADLQEQIRLLRDQLEHARQDHASVMAKAAEYQQAIQQLRSSRGIPATTPLAEPP